LLKKVIHGAPHFVERMAFVAPTICCRCKQTDTGVDVGFSSAF
jgi:hypothetical protein